MNFNTNLTEFPSAVHSSVYRQARGFVPPEYWSEDMRDSDLRASCADYHGFLLKMFSDMYDNPEAWHLPAGELEAFCGGRKLNAVRMQEPKKIASLVSQTNNSTHRYLMTLQKLGIYGELRGDNLYVSPNLTALINKQVSTPVSPITLDKRLSAFERAGLIQADGAFISTLYPKMFPALRALAQRSEKAGCIGHNFVMLTADFRYINNPKHKPKPEDFINPLIAVQRKQAEELHQYALKNGLKTSIKLFARIEYHYKSKRVMDINTRGANNIETLYGYDIRIKFANHSEGAEALTLINERMAQEPPEFQRKILRKLWRCNACGCTPNSKRRIKILGKKQLVCGDAMVGFKFVNPSDDDIETIKQLIDMRCEMINTAKK